VVVCIFHDHGSRYVGKVYNDQWMIERGFMEMKTFKDLVSARGKQKLIQLQLTSTVAEAVALMKKYEIENIPVIDSGHNIGAISESGLFNHLLSNPSLVNEPVTAVLEKPYPEVSLDTPVERLSQFITRENGAVLSRDEGGNYHIVTKYDIIQSISR